MIGMTILLYVLAVWLVLAVPAALVIGGGIRLADRHTGRRTALPRRRARAHVLGKKRRACGTVSA